MLLFNNALTYLPVKEFELPGERWEHLTTLDLSSNCLSSIPPALGEVASLRVLDLRFNQLQTLPPELGKLKVGLLSCWGTGYLTSKDESVPFSLTQELRALHLSKNYILDLPLEIFQLQLQTLALFGNPMQRVKRKIWEQCQGWRNTIDLSYQRIGASP